jgi:hypothetical protein
MVWEMREAAMDALENERPESVEPSRWNERVLMAAVIIAMLFSMLGYMRG